MASQYSGILLHLSCGHIKPAQYIHCAEGERCQICGAVVTASRIQAVESHEEFDQAASAYQAAVKAAHPHILVMWPSGLADKAFEFHRYRTQADALEFIGVFQPKLSGGDVLHYAYQPD